MDSNHRFLGVDQASLPLDHGTASFSGVTGVAPGSPACRAGVVLLDHDPIFPKRKPWDSNPQADLAAACFQAGSSTIRMASVKLRRLESNQHEDVQSVSSYR